MRSTSLQRALLLPLVVLSVAAMLVLGFAEWQELEYRMEKQISEQGETLVNMIGHAAEAVAEPSDVHRIVSAAGAERSVVSISFVAGSPRRVVASTHQAWRGLSLDQLPSPELRTDIDSILATREPLRRRREASEIIVFGAPLLMSQRSLSSGTYSDGVVVVELDRRSLHAELMQDAWTSLLGRGLVLLLGTGCVAIVLHWRIIKPVEAMRRALRNRSAGGSERIPVPAVLELRQLGEALNDSLDAVARSSERLALSEAFTRSIINEIPAMISVRNGNMEFVLVNRAQAEFLGDDAGSLQGKIRGELASSRAADRRAFEGQSQAGSTEEFVIDHDGRGLWLGRSRHRIAGPDGEPLLLTVSTDLTASKRHMQELQRAKEAAEAGARAKTEFLATMSHEIRTPMNGVLGCTELLLHTGLEDDQRQLVETIHGSGQHLLTIINDILDFSKIEAGHLSVSMHPVDVRTVTERVIALMQSQAAAKGLSLSREMEPLPHPSVLGDDGRLTQVLMNLIGNAIKFTQSGGVRIVVSAASQSALRISVVDTGLGIAPEVQEKLFQKFQQADSSTTRRFGGTGLGLAISKQLVELMGGRIGLDSSVGRGSTFWFEMPLADPVQQAATRDTASRAATADPATLDAAVNTTGVGGRILVAEDNAVNQLITTRLLEKLGFECDIAHDGEEAVAAVRSREYLLVLMDCHMPQMDGYRATEAIRRLEAGSARRTPIVALTAGVTEEERDRTLAAGMDDFVTKPVSARQLQEAIARAARLRSQWSVQVTEDDPRGLAAEQQAG